jgi:4-methyl-5(b-hydroxyethyl)-thiazole monophosphate biosynthesis
MVVFLFAEGFEELEAIAPADILNRCGKDVKFVSVTENNAVKGAHGFTYLCDMTFSDLKIEDIEMLVLPGGGLGVENLDAFAGLDSLLEYCSKNDLYIAAICAAPSLLGKRGYLQGKRATCFPGFEKYLTGATHTDEGVVVDGRIITSKAAGTAVDFGLTLASLLTSPQTSQKVGKAIYYER